MHKECVTFWLFEAVGGGRCRDRLPLGNAREWVQVT